MPFEQIANAIQGTDVARLNLLTNGGFEIWQRGNGPFTGFVWSADRWTFNGQGAASMSRDTANTDNSVACAAVTTNSSSTVGTPTQVFNTKILENGQIRGRTFSFSVRVRTATANVARVVLNDGSTNVYSAYHPGDGTYRTLTVTMTPGAGTLDALIAIEGAATTYVDNAMLVVGSVPADYAPLHPADDLARCLRYYETMGTAGGSVLSMQAYGAASGGVTLWLPYKAYKPVNPTVTKVGTWTVINASQPAIYAADTIGATLRTAATAAGGLLAENGGAGQYITVEANP